MLLKYKIILTHHKKMLLKHGDNVIEPTENSTGHGDNNIDENDSENDNSGDESGNGDNSENPDTYPDNG